ncbi:MAG: RagB/SusD family nutrient uptake outer membrane protein [Bacteroidales bacterium]
MRTYIKLIILLLLVATVSSCNFLDIVPDERPTEDDAFKDPQAARRFLYSCYSYLPNHRHASASLDLFTGDDVISAFEHATFAQFPRGNYNATSPVISYWNTLFSGLRQCYILKNNIANVPGIEANVIKDYNAQADFLIAYYHLLLIRCYGPTILIKEESDINTNPEDFLARSPLDECVQFVVDKFDESAAGLPSRRTGEEYGLATSVAAKALKARMLLYAASPLFNGETPASIKALANPDGSLLFPQSKDAQKWQELKTATQEAIAVADAAGYSLYKNTGYGENGYPADETQRTLRYNLIEPANSEILWADARNEGYYGLQNKCRPYVSAASWNGLGPAFAMLDRFYTENGLPIDEDPAYSYAGRFNVVTVTEADKDKARPGDKTLAYNLRREPRFYAWVSFQGGYYEVMSAASGGAYRDDSNFTETSTGGVTYSHMVTSFLQNDNCGRGNRTNNYAPSGYLNKKGCDPSFKTKSAGSSPDEYPWSVIRLADLYLMLAEASVETNDLNTAKTYLDKVRVRAGIPTVETSWSGVASLDQSKLRQIVRQERQVELYLENQNFWDMRRWLLAENYFNKKQVGINTLANTVAASATPTEIEFPRAFAVRNYLLPIPIKDVNTNTNLVQNPGY